MCASVHCRGSVQVSRAAKYDLSYVQYNQHTEQEFGEDAQYNSMYHDISEIETKKDRVRFRCALRVAAFFKA